MVTFNIKEDKEIRKDALLMGFAFVILASIVIVIIKIL